MSDNEKRRVIRARAEAMKRLPEAERDALIAADDNVLDGRSRFNERRIQAEMQQAYRKPPEGGLA